MANTVTVIMTVKNDADGCALTLESLTRQTRTPDEIIVVDGGSTDGTLELLRRATSGLPMLRVIESAGANIARGRNIATAAASHDLIASTDAGCRANADWLETLVQPFESQAATEVVAGLYEIEAQTLLEHVIGLVTMRGQLDPVDARTFNPSGRSIAYRKTVWQRAGGWPEWLRFSEDTLFDHKLRLVNAEWKVAPQAVVRWRPRRTLRALARQFYSYGTGRGHTRIDAASFRYNLRNLLLVLGGLAACAFTPWAVPIVACLTAYFGWWAHHRLAARISRRCGRRAAYPLALLVTWVVQSSNLAGFLVGSLQRRMDRPRYQLRMSEYMRTETQQPRSATA